MNTPDEITRLAYADLVGELFLRLRNRAVSEEEQLHELGDAMHNISGILREHGAWIDDQEYRKLYLAPYDERWGSKKFSLQRFLDERIEFYSRK